MKKFLCFLLAFLLLASLIPAASAAETSSALTDISLTVGADESRMNFTWYAPVPDPGQLLIAKEDALVDGQMPPDAVRYPAAAVKANDGDYYSNQASASGLEPETAYAYQMVNGTLCSEIGRFTTGSVGAFSFAFVGDPQIGAGDDLAGDIAQWANTLEVLAENEVFSDISFLLTAGDHVNKDADEEQYDGYLHHDFLQSLPTANVIGNHDSDSTAFGQHFHLPNESTQYGVTDAGGNAWFVYNNVLFLLLNSNDKSAAEHRQFMEDAIAANPDASWKIVALHHSLYTVSKHAEDKSILQRRKELVPIFQDLDIDVVLMGHDHVYCRTYMMDGLIPMRTESIYNDETRSSVSNPVGILYLTVNSGTATKTYDCKDKSYPYSAVQNQEHVPNISKISISDTSFSITTYRAADMSVVDRFEIFRSEDTGLPFTEVDSGDWFFDAVEYAYDRGVTSGTTDTRFSPDTVCTRAQAVTFLWRAAGSPAPEGFDTAFTDIEPDAYYYEAVAWAVEEGITNGYGSEAVFAPDLTCTRAQIVTLLWRYMGEPGSSAQSAPFTDLRECAYYHNAVLWAAEEGVTNGCGSTTTFCPDLDCTRSQIVTFLYRAMTA